MNKNNPIKQIYIVLFSLSLLLFIAVLYPLYISSNILLIIFETSIDYLEQLWSEYNNFDQ